WLIEATAVGIFIIEYAARIYSCTSQPKYRHPVFGRIRYALRPMMIVDLCAILPSLLPMVGIDLRVLRLLRIFRLIRVLRLGRSTGALDIMGAVLSRTREELAITLVFVAVLIIITASLMHAAEADAQPEVFGSIPDAVWWAVVTLTTVGYGDAYPITTMGRYIAGVLAVLGVGLVGLPAGILGAGFMQEMDARKKAAAKRKKAKPST
ncbi:MAG: ion transporter, partial [Planctomycetota bacterium]